MKNDHESMYKWRAMLVVSIGTFMATLDASIVNLALPILKNYFNTDIATIQVVPILVSSSELHNIIYNAIKNIS